MSGADRDTIAAIASPPGGGERGVIRISGPRARALIEATVAIPVGADLSRRGAWRGRFDDGRGTQPVLFLWMPAPRSYTREDVAELHLQGSPPLLAAALRRLIALGARAALRGEFTRRAFENGRIDLTRAEGVLELTAAANDAERRAASALLFGGLSDRIDALRALLVEARVLCEASLDFDEADTGDVPREEILLACERARGALEEALGFELRRSHTSASARIALVGAPNAGKTSLFNALTGHEALVSAHGGTTRDALRGHWTVAGIECELWDTAGLAGPTGEAAVDSDAAAQRIARAHHGAADLWLVVVDSSRSGALELARAHGDESGPSARVLVWSQVDRPSAASSPPPRAVELARASEWVAVSAHSRDGIAELEGCAARALGWTAQRAEAQLAGPDREISARHRAALDAAKVELDGARAALSGGEPLDLASERLREATAALDAICGRTTPEDLLDLLFARFCIGK